MSEQATVPAQPAPVPVKDRQQDAIYQNGQIVGRVLEPEVDLQTKELRFGEICNSDTLIIPDECEYQKYRLIIQSIAHASRIDRNATHRGRVLRGVRADILGYLE